MRSYEIHQCSIFETYHLKLYVGKCWKTTWEYDSYKEAKARGDEWANSEKCV